ncbi:ankyrin repeat-containing domain protein [Lentinula novae-zelandiae]|nr:ankyrin repeat-containing domain protein [Lentinula novae-zelandiae]
MDDFNAVGRYGSALATAAYFRNENTVKYLLENGANINEQGVVYGNALQATICDGNMDEDMKLNEDMINFLLENGADIETQSGEYRNALQAAAYHGNENILNKVLEKGVNLQHFWGNRAAVECLLEQEANVNAQEAEFGSTLGAVAYRNNKDMVKYHPERGADINIQGGRFGKVLQTVAFWGHGDMGGGYSSALQVAAFNGCIDIDACYVSNGKDTDSQGHSNDDNVLNGALCGGNKWVVRLPSDNGAEINTWVVNLDMLSKLLL